MTSMLHHILLSSACLLIGCSVAIQKTNTDPILKHAGMETTRSSTELIPFIPDYHVILDTAFGDLNMDGITDVLLALEIEPTNDSDEINDSEEPRPLKILLRNESGELTEAKHNDRVILCAGCGGVMGDPFLGLEIMDGKFTAYHYGGSAWRWSQDIVFAYDKARNDWFLDAIHAVSFHVMNEDSTMQDMSKERDELGTVPFESYDHDQEYKQE